MSVVIAPTAPPTVVTVLWATTAAWQEDHDNIGSRPERDQTHINSLRRAIKAQKRKTRGRGY